MSRAALVPASAILDERLNPRDVTVLAAFCSFSDASGWQPVDVGAIGSALGASPASVQKSVRLLCSCGYMEIRRQALGGAGLIRVLYDFEQPAQALRKARAER